MNQYQTLNTSNIDISNFEHFEHDPQILRPNIELLLGSIRPEFLAHIWFLIFLTWYKIFDSKHSFFILYGTLLQSKEHVKYTRKYQY